MHLSRSPPPRSLRAFCLAARHRSFKVAADELFLTPSAVSHQIKELEDTLGVQLFERKTRALELTTAGHTLLEEVAPLLDALDRSLTQIARRGSRKKLRVQVPPFFASELFLPRLGSFWAAHPDIDLQLETRGPRPSLHPPTADVSILLTDSPPQGMKITRLFAVQLTAACATEHAATIARLGRDVFNEMSLIVHKARPFAWAEWAEEAGLHTPEPKNLIEVDTTAALVSAAEQGLGLALVPDALCATRFQAGSLMPIFRIKLPVNDTYFLVSRIKDADKPEVAALLAWAREEFCAFDERRSPVPAASAAAL